eukprot:SM000058S18534  [mRNA]  locus=s58:476712:480382:+ [translate_table: standard]
MFGPRFQASKCKTLMKVSESRIKLMRNKLDVQLRQMRRDIATLLRGGQEASAQIRVEHIMRDQNIMAAYEVLELFCELIVVRLPMIESKKECPPDLLEAISSIIYAAPRVSDIPELLDARGLFQAKYGKEFVASASELRPGSGVSRLIIEKLSVRAPPGELKLQLLEQIAKENNVEWDSTRTAEQLLEMPEDLLNASSAVLGPNFAQTVAESHDAEAPVTGQQAPAPLPAAQYNPTYVKPAPVANAAAVAVARPLHNDEEPSTEDHQFIPFVIPAPQEAPATAYSQQPYHAAPLLPAGMKYSPLLGKPPTSSMDVDESLSVVDLVPPPLPRQPRTVPGAVKDEPMDEEFEGFSRRSQGLAHFADVEAAAAAAAESAQRAIDAANAAAGFVRSGSAANSLSNSLASGSVSPSPPATKLEWRARTSGTDSGPSPKPTRNPPSSARTKTYGGAEASPKVAPQLLRPSRYDGVSDSDGSAPEASEAGSIEKGGSDITRYSPRLDDVEVQSSSRSRPYDGRGSGSPMDPVPYRPGRPGQQIEDGDDESRLLPPVISTTPTLTEERGAGGSFKFRVPTPEPLYRSAAAFDDFVDSPPARLEREPSSVDSEDIAQAVYKYSSSPSGESRFESGRLGPSVDAGLDTGTNRPWATQDRDEPYSLSGAGRAAPSRSAPPIRQQASEAPAARHEINTPGNEHRDTKYTYNEGMSQASGRSVTHYSNQSGREDPLGGRATRGSSFDDQFEWAPGTESSGSQGQQGVQGSRKGGHSEAIPPRSPSRTYDDGGDPSMELGFDDLTSRFEALKAKMR